MPPVKAYRESFTCAYELLVQRNNLLDALEDLATLVDNDADDWQIHKSLENARNAIAKAKGEAQTSYTLNKLKSEIEQLKAQRAELLEACNDFVNAVRAESKQEIMLAIDAADKKARAAIAKAKGEAWAT